MHYLTSEASKRLIVKAKPKRRMPGLFALAVTTLMAQSASARDLCLEPECYQSYAAYSNTSLLHKENGFGGAYLTHDFESQGQGYGLTSNAAAEDFITPEGAHFSSSASASLSTGALHVFTAQSGATTSAVAKISDMVKFSLPTGATTALATISFTVEGTNDYIDGVTRSFVDFGLSVNRNFNQQTLVDFTSRDTGKPYYQALDGIGFHTLTLTQSFEVNGDDIYNFAASLVAVAVPETDYVTREGEYVYKAGESSANYGNTAFFSLSLPEGVNFQSASGTFLSSPYVATPVPEPSAWVLMMFGCGFVGLVVRRQRHTAGTFA